MGIQFDRLEHVGLATKLSPLENFRMDRVYTKECGTAGCMIGNYNAMFGRPAEYFGHAPGSIAYFFTGGSQKDWEHFGITVAEYHWVFGMCGFLRSEKNGEFKEWHTPVRDLETVTREQALARLYKFIAYKKRKHELIHDEKYGASERSRKAEGNQGFVMLAVADALAAVPASVATAS